MSTNPKLKKYADKIRTIAQECEGPDKKPDKYFTKEILDRIDAAAHKEFLYGQIGIDEVTEEENGE